MKQQCFDFTAAFIFGLVAIVHIIRISQGWNVMIGDTVLPMWTSWLGFIVTGALSIWGFSLAASNRFRGNMSNVIDNVSSHTR